MKSIFSKGRARAEERRVMSEAKKHKLISGISLPVHGAGAEGSMLSLCSSKRKMSVSHDMQYGLQIIAQAIHESVKRVVAKSTDLTSMKRETYCPRKGMSELDCSGQDFLGNFPDPSFVRKHDNLPPEERY